MEFESVMYNIANPKSDRITVNLIILNHNMIEGNMHYRKLIVFAVTLSLDKFNLAAVTNS